MSVVHFCWLFYTCLVLLEVFTFMLVVCSFVCPLTRQPPRWDGATLRLIVIVAQIETRAHKIQFPSHPDKNLFSLKDHGIIKMYQLDTFLI